MTINNFKLPEAFVRDLQSGRLLRHRGCWKLRKAESAYGDFLECDLGEVYNNQTRIQRETDNLASGYDFLGVEEVEEFTEMFGIQPSEIPYFWDFSKIVVFAVSGDGADFCFDFRDDEENPSVIWWADTYWQRVAPNYESFVALFEIPE